MMNIALSAAFFEIKRLKEERDAARAEAARAVEALRKLSEQVAISAKDSFGTCEEWLDSYRLEAPDECAAYEEAVAVLSSSDPALDWLAQQRREAAAEAMTPKPITEEHRDGNWWLVWEPFCYRWITASWRERSEMWVRPDDGYVVAPAHALPLPPAPEGE